MLAERMLVSHFAELEFSERAELAAVVAGITAAESVAAILEKILGQDLVMSALCDNSAMVRAFSWCNQPVSSPTP